MNLPNLTAIRDGIRYRTDNTTELASDVYWDGNNMERHGRNTWLLRGQNGRYFSVNASQWQGETDHISPLTEDEAAELYETLPTKHLDWEEAFPNRPIEDA